MAKALGNPASRRTYNCIVKNCDKSFRGDKFKSHFEKYSDLLILEQAVKMDNVVLGIIIQNCGKSISK